MGRPFWLDARLRAARNNKQTRQTYWNITRNKSNLFGFLPSDWLGRKFAVAIAVAIAVAMPIAIGVSIRPAAVAIQQARLTMTVSRAERLDVGYQITWISVLAWQRRFLVCEYQFHYR